jgi:pimeloyl-ACP methyl ester carboxylesterase
MKGAKQLFGLIPVFIISACVSQVTAGVAADPFVAGKVIDTVRCKTDPTQSYALYIPAKGNKGPLPVIYFFDPHGNGALPLKKYQSLAEAYGFILAGSNNSKNGNDWPATEKIWRHLPADVQARLKIDGRRIYTCGFSGGAKVAGYVALQHHEVKGVIANGAGLPDGVPAADLPFSFTAVTGEGDMNMTELVNISKELDKYRGRHYLIVYDGKHEWAPVGSMETAWAGLQLDAMRMGLLPRDNGFISRYILKSKQRLDLYARTNQLLKAGREYKLSISFLDGLGSADEVAWFQKGAASMAGNAVYRKQEQAEERLLLQEQNTKAEYMQHFQQGDPSYWVRTIDDLRVRSNKKNDERAMNQRLLAYLSLAFYSISNHLINGNANREARHFVDLYKMADPGNSEAWYFSAILDMRERNGAGAERDLIKAVECGFRDEGRLGQQSEFKDATIRIDIPGIERRMREPVKGN